MEPNLLVGDRLFVSKYSYGYSKHSFPFSPKIFNGRIFFKSPKRGDVIVFKTPSDNRTDYIKRLIGLPGDTIQFIDGNIYLNNTIIGKTTSGNYSFNYNKNLSFGYINSHLTNIELNEMEIFIEIEKKKYQAEILLRPLKQSNFKKN